MSKKDEALKLALEALEKGNELCLAIGGQTSAVFDPAITAIREALAEQPAQQQKPVAWKDKIYGNLHHQDFGNSIPLYTSPPASKPWVGLTEKEKRDARNSVSYSPLAMTMGEWTEAVQDATEAKLREKNA